MDISYTETKLHPKIDTFLFECFDKLSTVFSHVLGHFAVDYISITLLNEHNEILFLSSKPSIECNLIKNNLWQYDQAYQASFFNTHELKYWTELYDEQQKNELYYFKQKIPKFNLGLAVPSTYQNMKVVFSFATKSRDKRDIHKIAHDPAGLIRMGNYCLHTISQTITLPDTFTKQIKQQSHLKLIVNNEVHYENVT